MKRLGFWVAGFQFGMAWAVFFACHGHAYTAREGTLSAVLGTAVFLVASL